MEQALDAGHDLQERPVLLGLRDLAIDDRTDRHRLDELLPRVLLKLAQRQRDACLLGVELDHLDRDLVSELKHIGHL